MNMNKTLSKISINHVQLKWIAAITMLIDHIGVVFNGPIWLQIIGRLSFPIFAFCIAQGYVHTRDIKQYMLRMLGFGMGMQLLLILFTWITRTTLPTSTFNIFITLSFGLAAIWFYDLIPNKIMALAVIFFGGILADVMPIDYGAYGIFMIVAFYIFRDSKPKMAIAMVVLNLLLSLSLLFGSFIPSQALAQFFTINANIQWFSLLALIPIFLYNGELGKHEMKYFFYIFYPAHLIILYVLAIVLRSISF
ncbi:TraX family protein [Culicoidibacter larvae]|uniref:Conjugal transfer protein TraX n=1 Tax=Culicoidibacter larvae TaxID=2579976 RepID=A0A5R8Q9F0_9FIRM|nr:TraX family protein [Culicoidibacter larvae]TLG72543.1 hypothetical protein FEZ08_09145 [Culicoidibacter larvae]